ncbi:hypothetical protein EJ08DRAFT_738411 [Tothia fuscella]|uniref:Uncharacterized protein n=1 Tax=Tothia fuscella TaxID=1048955 RepID=A0A9P4NH54_9PEZI|nr:hypothetical protein EJ08DRAFT_738411 [Tothia fuscella]
MVTTTMTIPKEASLLGIPAELRLAIYGYLFDNLVVRYADVSRPKSNGAVKSASHESNNNCPQLLWTCKTFWVEALPIFYSKITLATQINPISNPTRFLRRIGPRATAAVTGLKLLELDSGYSTLTGVECHLFRDLRSLKDLVVQHHYYIAYPDYSRIGFGLSFSETHPFPGMESKIYKSLPSATFFNAMITQHPHLNMKFILKINRSTGRGFDDFTVVYRVILSSGNDSPPEAQLQFESSSVVSESFEVDSGKQRSVECWSGERAALSSTF